MTICLHCGAQHTETCEENFHTLLFWEMDGGLFAEHHLLVLCYQLQHPYMLTQSALEVAQDKLKQVLDGQLSVNEFREQMQKQAKNRDYKIKGTESSHAIYPEPIHWQMTLAEVVDAGIHNYYASVRQWAKSIHEDLAV